MEKIWQVGVVGAGMMGGEIALCFASYGHEVVIKDETLELAENGKNRLKEVLDRAIKKGTFPAEDKAKALGRIVPTDRFDAFKEVDLVIEAVFEETETKKQVFMELDEMCKPDCLFATNTSSIPITLLASFLKGERIGRFLGTHFFSPAFVMKLVEVIPGLETTKQTVSLMLECCRKINKVPIQVKDVPGFAVNRILHASWIEVCRLLEENIATAEDIDTACKLGLGYPIGPFALMDLTANDLNLKVCEVLYEAYGERFKPRPILKQKVYANHLGRKTGRGWYEYEK